MPELVFTNSKTVFTNDVVPTQDQFTWQLQVTQMSEENLLVQWPIIEQKGDKQLMLLDLTTQRVVDMTREQSITLSPASKSLKIIFGNQDYIAAILEKELPAIGQPYPNPAHEEVKIPFYISESLDQANVSIRIYSSAGSELATVVDDYFSKGRHVLSWKPSVPNGLYIIAMTVGSGEARRVKLIIQ